MNNSTEVANLNRLLEDIKILSGSLAVLDRFIAAKDSIAQRTALDAINFRIREVAKNASIIKDAADFDITAILVELSKPESNIKALHELLTAPIEELRKRALSQILTLSLEV
ncbi:unannotated protein [freshwater metagenome]|uniref:Unannotated protein n=1 Tax=freshwater metagenome TaxID=449393 RepID=A0A6J6TJB6_9ZZZZ|nr:hypothetical protein [Actinomycetota bacterium]